MINHFTDANSIITFIIAAFGTSAALVGWWISRMVVNVPKEDREFKDDPPIGFKILWWPIQWISFYLPQKDRTEIQVKLRQAGLDFSLGPNQFIAGRIVCALILGITAYILLLMLNDPSTSESFSASTYLQSMLIAMLFGWFYPAIWLKDKIAIRRKEITKTLPFFLDIITLCVEAGLNLQGAINQAVLRGPSSVLRDELQRVLRDIRAGKARAESLRSMAERLQEPGINSFVSSVIQAENMGMNMGPILRAQADQRRTERFLRAEKQAMEAPVKMLLPLIAFIFPCTFIVLLFPIAMQMKGAGF